MNLQYYFPQTQYLVTYWSHFIKIPGTNWMHSPFKRKIYSCFLRGFPKQVITVYVITVVPVFNRQVFHIMFNWSFCWRSWYVFYPFREAIYSTLLNTRVHTLYIFVKYSIFKSKVSGVIKISTIFFGMYGIFIYINKVNLHAKAL